MVFKTKSPVPFIIAIVVVILVIAIGAFAASKLGAPNELTTTDDGVSARWEWEF